MNYGGRIGGIVGATMVVGALSRVGKKNKMTAGKRRKGKPRTYLERKARHKRLHPRTPLPVRGTGRRKSKGGKKII